MPRLLIGGRVIRRKHFYLPCAIAEHFDELPEAQQATVLRDTQWADLITAAEWRFLLASPGAKPSARSSLKRKSVYWMMALGRIYALNPTLYNEIADRAKAFYRRQLGSNNPIFGPDETSTSSGTPQAGNE